MAGFSTWPALLERLRAEWGLSATEAGLVGGVFSAGYMLAVPVLSALTDRFDARWVYAVSAMLSALACTLFGTLANGLVAALVLEAMVGAGLAGTYMPGLKILVDEIDAADKSRYIALYTATFGFGASGSLFLASAVEPAFGWRVAFAVSGLGPVVAAALVFLLAADRRPRLRDGAPWREALRAVLRNRLALLFMLGYAAHCWELFGLRGWFVAFLSASGFGSGGGFAAATIVGILTLVGPLASIAGNELARRVGHLRWIRATMVSSALLAVAVALAARAPAPVLIALSSLYFLVVMADSAALTAGLIEASSVTQRGVLMGVHSALGFAAGFASPLTFGALLDLAGGVAAAGAWNIAFAALGGAGLAWILAAKLLKVRIDRPEPS